MYKIDKFLKRLTPKEKEQIKKVLKQISSKNFSRLDIKKLKDREDVFRVRKGDIRIIYRVEGEDIFVLAIERRSEKTYK